MNRVKTSMRLVNICLLSVLLLFAGPSYAFAPTEKTIQVIIPFGPGGGTDLILRQMQKYADKQNIKLIASYKPGANGALGIQALHSSAPDGYTMGIFTFDTIGQFQITNKIQADAKNIVSIQKNAFGIVSSSKSDLPLREFMRKKTVTAGYLLLSQKALLEELHSYYGGHSQLILVPYKSGGEMIQNLIGGDLDIGITSLSVLAPMVKANRLTLLSTDSETPFNDFQNVATVGSLDKKFISLNKGSGLLFPHNTPGPIIQFWQGFIMGYLTDPEVKSIMDSGYAVPVYRNTKETEDALHLTIKMLSEVK